MSIQDNEVKWTIRKVGGYPKGVKISYDGNKILVRGVSVYYDSEKKSIKLEV